MKKMFMLKRDRNLPEELKSQEAKLPPDWYIKCFNPTTALAQVPPTETASLK